MTLFEDLTPAQEKIIKEICYIQLSSLRRIYNNDSLSDVDLVMLLIKEDVSKEEFTHRLEMRMEYTKKLGREPKKISTLKDEDLSVFKHILANIEDKYKSKYPNAIANLWSRFFILEDFNKFNTN